MFYIALAFLVGVLWIKFKVISISLILTLLLLIMIKRLNIIILLLMFISAISSFFLISSYNQTEIKNINSLYNEPFIDDFVRFKSFTLKSTYYTGILNYKNKDWIKTASNILPYLILVVILFHIFASITTFGIFS